DDQSAPAAAARSPSAPSKLVPERAQTNPPAIAAIKQTPAVRKARLVIVRISRIASGSGGTPDQARVNSNDGNRTCSSAFGTMRSGPYRPGFGDPSRGIHWGGLTA